MNKWSDPEIIERTFEEICLEIERGITLRSICRRDGMPSRSVVYEWIEADEERKGGRIARARRLGHDEINEECFEIADRASPTTENGSTDAGDVAHRKLQIWTRQQLLAKWDPGRYGDKIEVKQTGKLSVSIDLGDPS